MSNCNRGSKTSFNDTQAGDQVTPASSGLIHHTDRSGQYSATTWLAPQSTVLLVGSGDSVSSASIVHKRALAYCQERFTVRTLTRPIGGSTQVNEIQYTYNAFGQITREQQQHGAAVNTFSPAVQYVYANGSNNTIRQTFIKHPNSRQIDFVYGTSGGQND